MEQCVDIAFNQRYSLLLDLSRAELGEAMAQTTADGLGSVHLGIGPDGNVLDSTGVNVAGDIAAEQVNLGRRAILVNELDVLEPVGVGHETSLGLGGGGDAIGVSAGLGPLGTGGLLDGGLGAEDGGGGDGRGAAASKGRAEGRGRSGGEEEGEGRDAHLGVVGVDWRDAKNNDAALAESFGAGRGLVH